MKKHALDLVVGHFVKVIKTIGAEGGLTKHYPSYPGWGVLCRTDNPALLKNLVTETLRFDVPLGTMVLSE